VKTLAQRYEIPQVYDTVDALLASAPADAVSVVTAHGHHLPAALGRIFLATTTVKLRRSAEYYRRGP